MPDQNTQVKKASVLSGVRGYQEVVDHQAELAKTGTDYLEQRGAVANTVGRLHPKRIKLVVDEIREDTPSTGTLRLVTEDGGTLPPFQAGQYINLFVSINNVETARPYAISSSPQSLEYYDLTVKRVDPGFVSHHLLDQIEVGERLLSTGPMGTFYHNPLFHGEQLVFLAGGSGIAPAISMIRDIAERALPYRFHLIYSSSYEVDVIFERELKLLEEAHDFLTIDWVITRPSNGYNGHTGRLSADFLEKQIGSLESKTYYICGPTPFNEWCEQQLAELEIKPRRIRVECNGPPSHPEQLQEWPTDLPATKEVTVTIQGKGSFKALSGEPLLNSMERNGYGAENACRSGECSLCRVKVVSGSVLNPKEARLRASDAQYGWCHSCVAFPTEDIEIIV
ncbi:2Fe-2S iron-sulfur cluster binding domain-containing protein [Halioglobus maricola]|uniref:2Fe-2S iron-sulfur cluster binding domain-containing protein n=1 Tax=Halioglobus maricola TaxID=2601894 RepID=A0A5P9NKC0_9GAMM|nr:FAD-binding oxidoreductase [Halioglobus maricola]QFU76290.1 2Fe-2S iron-sulfur cluster binding domain-containing protein [Halioglobus maricola]